MRAIFLDRDGVISENRDDHVKSWDEFRFLPGALEAIALLRESGFRVFVVTNQAIVNRGVVSAEVIDDIHARMLWQVVQHGGFIDDIQYCPHDYGENCHCRKPRPGMITALAAKWNIDLSQSYIIGDAWTDIAAGRTANCRCIMVRTGRGTQHLNLPEAQRYTAHYVAADLPEAIDWLFAQEDIALPHCDRNLRMPQLVNSPWSAALS
jgi:D-glycero-D-manno-heptose 1,7-bisphosphate phosphatase